MAETLSTLSIISFAAAGVFLVLAVFLWFFLKIPSVIGDLSGKTARKSIAKMRAVNEKTGAKGNGARGKMSGAAPRQVPPMYAPGSSDPVRPKAASPRKQETVLLKDNQQNNFVPTEETTPLDGTELLVDEEKTELLRPEDEQKVRRTGGVKLVMKEEVMIIHTDEVIE